MVGVDVMVSIASARRVVVVVAPVRRVLGHKEAV